MPPLAPNCSVVTRAVDILAAAGIRVLPISTKRIDRDEFEGIEAELGIEADERTFVRDAFAPTDAAD